MHSESDTVVAADLNYIGSYRKLAAHNASGAVREFGPVMAFTTGLPLGIFNGCIVVDRVDEADLNNALRWIRARDVPYRVWIRESLRTELREALLRSGLEQENWLLPGMVLQPAPESPAPAAGVAVRPVEGPRALEEHLGVLVRGGMPAELASRMYPASFASDPDVRLFTAYLAGGPIGTSLALRTGEVSGVYAVGTLPEARRRGIGTAATWAAVAAGRAWGCETITLQSTEMAFSMYCAMGFRTVVRYVTLRPPKS